MEYSVQNEAQATRVALSGQLTFADSQKFRSMIDNVLQTAKSLCLDFKEVDFIDSAGLGMLLMLRDMCQNKHIPISIQSPRGQVEKVFFISKFDQLFSFGNEA